MNAYGRFCPISMGTDVLADRWTPLILRELLFGSTRFNDIARGLPGISRSLLVKRLQHLERCGVLDRWPDPSGNGAEYVLTPAGRDLESVVFALGRWAVEWLYDELSADDVDAVTLMWWMHHRINGDLLPPRRVVVQFDHTAPRRRTIWIILENGEGSVCMNHPRLDSDLVVTAPTSVIAEIFSGARSWDRELRCGSVTVEGAPALARAIPKWFGTSPFADDVRRLAAPTPAPHTAATTTGRQVVGPRE